MNKHIELVKKWLDDPDSVTVDELKVNADAAVAAYVGADADAAADAADAADAAAYAAYAAAADAAYAAYATAADSAAYRVKKYEELTGE
jgi:hypothetical protein